MTEPQGHSPLGGSGAYRWIPCPGSVRLSYGLKNESSSFAAQGTAAHGLAEYCLNWGHDAWEFTGVCIAPDGKHYPATWEGELPEGCFTVDQDMTDAVQVYLAGIRKRYPDRNQGNSWIEKEFHCPLLHDLMWGKADFTYLDEDERTLHIWDYKHGAGIVVEVKDNPQLMYYGVGIMDDLMLWDKVDTVVLYVAQPRGFHPEGAIRSWAISTDDLWAWASKVLFPAMDAAMVSSETASGEHCRFCPSRHYDCPQLSSDMDELEELMKLMKKDQAAALSNEQVGRYLELFDIAKIISKAANETAHARLMAGKGKGLGRKLVKARANRAWNDDAEKAGREMFGGAAYTEPVMKSPAVIDKLPRGEAFTAQYAFKPDTGLQVVKDKDNRAEVSRDTKSLFKPTKGKK